jgi:mono/diheme cytochrome c family protein
LSFFIKKIFMKQLLIVLGMVIFASCGGNDSGNTSTGSPNTGGNTSTTNTGAPPYDPQRGVGKFTNVEVSPNLDAKMADAGEKVYQVKCASCHKLTDERLVGPGWAGVSERNTAEWIMNFSTNPDEMLDKDPKAQAQLEICLVRMPNQNLTDDDARNVYEFMRKNDGVK